MAENKKVFVSYSSRNNEFVNILVKELEAVGIGCWKAPEMIAAGSSYAREIPKAIRDCEVFLLVLSRTSQDSIWVEKEIDNAISARKHIIPLQIDNVMLNEAFQFYLNNVQRIMYVDNGELALKELKEQLRIILGMPEIPDVEEEEIVPGQGSENKGPQVVRTARRAIPVMRDGRKRTGTNSLRINRIPLECEACGCNHLENISMGVYKCPDCGKENYDDFTTIRNFLEKYGPATAFVIEQRTGVPKKTVDYYFREEYLEIPVGSSIRVPCEKCGAPIRTGRLCDNCKNGKTYNSSSRMRGSWHTK